MKLINFFLLIAFLFNYSLLAYSDTLPFEQPQTPESSYLDLLKRSLLNIIYQTDSAEGSCNSFTIINFNLEKRLGGKDWPLTGHTMIGWHRLTNIQNCIETILKDDIEGDLIETGVWRGGATILMRGALKIYRDSKRRVFVADSFEGLPAPNVTDYPEDKGMDLDRQKFLAVSLEDVKENFRRYGLLDDKVIFLKGWFKDTLPKAPMDKISLLRLDGDLYESTMDALKNLYPKLSIGGFVIIDDFNMPCCVKAVNDYRAMHNIKDVIYNIDGFGVYWRKNN